MPKNYHYICSECGLLQERYRNSMFCALCGGALVRVGDIPERMKEVTKLALKHKLTWRKRSNFYWLMRMLQEIVELAMALAGRHHDPPERELQQIASIAVNWLDKLEVEAATNGNGEL
jgi:PHP family Zn ribbon phosphoesterase